MAAKTYVIGVGMTKFEKPGARGWDYPDMAFEAGTKALTDAGVPYDSIEQASVGFCFADSGAGQRAVYGLGLTGIPVLNVNNNCATGSSALFIIRNMVAGGVIDCGLALGFEKMDKDAILARMGIGTSPVDRHYAVMSERRGFTADQPAAQMFGNAGREYMERYGVKPEAFAMIGEKNHRHSANNPYSQFREVYTLDDVLAAPMVYDPLTRLQCCPTSDGAAAAVIASERFVREHELEARSVEIAGMAMATDLPSTFESGSDMKLVGYDLTVHASRKAYEESGLGPEDMQVVELHDCFSANELITYEALGLCAEGKAGDLVHEGATTYGGRWVVNPSGGLISKGHPLGATGLAQCAELTWQLRGEAEARQVDGARAALQHNLGLGGAAVVAVDVVDSKLELARQLGAEHVVNAAAEDPVAAIKALGGADAAVVTAVSPKAFRQAYGALRRRGRVVFVALPADNQVDIPIFETVLNGITVVGSIVGTRVDLAETFELHARGRTRVIRETRSLDDVNDAMGQVERGEVDARVVFDLREDAT